MTAEITLYWVGQALLIVSCLTILFSLDDIIVDFIYWAFRLTGALRRRLERESLETPLNARPVGKLAILVPAWQESDVIYPMLRANLESLADSKAEFFVGIYQNDPETLAEVRRAQVLSSRVHIVIVPRPGPTCKADCLNEIINSILEKDHADQESQRFAGFVLHDAEDLIRPLEPNLFDVTLDRYDFIQLPVYSFTRRPFDWFGATYMDEFAESHSKDLLVRAWVSDFTPCAGVAACFKREALEMLKANAVEGEIFKSGSLTEDYDVAFRIASLGMKSTFLHRSVPFYKDTPVGKGAPQEIRKPMVVSTRENFPSTLRTAYRQRARWLLGIALISAREFGWIGKPSTRFFLLRDRKCMITTPLVAAGYILFCVSLALSLWIGDGALTPLFVHTPFAVPTLILIVIGLMVWRMLNRFYFTTSLYGLRHGILSLPRILVSNLVNFFAVWRALRLYMGHRLFGKNLVWDKTPHTYPASKLVKPAKRGKVCPGANSTS